MDVQYGALAFEAPSLSREEYVELRVGEALENADVPLLRNSYWGGPVMTGAAHRVANKAEADARACWDAATAFVDARLTEWPTDLAVYSAARERALDLLSVSSLRDAFALASYMRDAS